MPFDVDIALKKQFKVKCPFDRVFDTLADVPYSADHFPKVRELVDLGDEKYRWEMEKIGIDRYSIQTIYACEYTWDKDEGWIKWEPVDGEGNAVVHGKWVIKEIDPKSTHVSFVTTGTLTLPLPSLAKIIVGPIVSREFESMVNQYIENLKKTWSE